MDRKELRPRKRRRTEDHRNLKDPVWRALDDWRMKETVEIFGTAMAEQYGPSLIMPQRLFEMVYEHREKIKNQQDLRRETGWSNCPEKVGIDLIAFLVNQRRPSPPPEVSLAPTHDEPPTDPHTQEMESMSEEIVVIPVEESNSSLAHLVPPDVNSVHHDSLMSNASELQHSSKSDRYVSADFIEQSDAPAKARPSETEAHRPSDCLKADELVTAEDPDPPLMEPAAPDATQVDIEVMGDEPAPPPMAPEQIDPTMPWIEPFLMYMYFRFGFTYPRAEGSNYVNMGSWNEPLSDEDLKFLKGKVFYEGTVLDVLEVNLRRDLFHFISMLDSNDGPPACLWDLRPTNERHLVRTDARVTVELAGASQVKGLSGNFYSLRAGPAQESCVLLVSDPSVAVECLRRQFETTRDVISFFLCRGTPFTLAFPGQRNAPPTPPLPIKKPSDFKPTPALYIEWENAARAFMESPRSHLVWRLGGLYWRLALFLVGTTPLANTLLDTAPGLVTQCVTPTAYEELLTEEEIDILIGNYHVASAHANQPTTMDLSFWPHPKLNRGTRFDTSCWTPLNEQWFTTRLAGLQDGSITAQKQNDWRHYLRGRKVHRKIIEETRNAAASFLGQ